MEASNPPVGLSYAVFMRADGLEWPLGLFAVAAHCKRTQSLTLLVGDLNLRRIDVVLKPDTRAAILSPDVEEAWDQELIIKDVPVTSRLEG